MSSLTTCDELREARSEIKRVPENLRGSARSNYLHEARGVRTVKRVDIFFRRPFILSQFSPSHFPRRVYHAIQMCVMKRGRRKRNYFGLLFALGFIARWYVVKRVEGGGEDNERCRTHGTQYDA